jgi:hypothetical protein
VPRTKQIESVFLNIPYDEPLEDLYLSWVHSLFKVLGASRPSFRLHFVLFLSSQSLDVADW